MSTDHFVFQCFDTVGWAVYKSSPKLTCYMSGGTLNLTHSLDVM